MVVMMSVSGQMQVADRSATEARLAGTAVVALAVGASVYLLDRDWVSTLFLGPFAAWQPARQPFPDAGPQWVLQL